MKSKLMQGQGFKHPIKINLSAVIDLTRGFLMLFKVFLEDGFAAASSKDAPQNNLYIAGEVHS